MGDASGYDDIADALRAIVRRCGDEGDRNGYFAAMYLAVTQTVRQRSSDGRFAEPARMEGFITAFARRYLDALAAWRAKAPCPAAWEVAFRAAPRWRPVILQHLLLGMNAHINLDLGVTASSIGGDGPIEAVRADFDAVNDVLGELVDGCQGALGAVSPWFGLVDRIGGRGDETLIRFSLQAARRQAWNVAVRLHGRQGRERSDAVDAVDAAAARVGRAVEHPGLPASALLLAVRARERAEPAAVMALLAAVRPAV